MQIQSTILHAQIVKRILELKSQQGKRNITMCFIVKIVGRLLLENVQVNLPKTTMRTDVVNVGAKSDLTQNIATIRF